jgi:hypothetical protein
MGKERIRSTVILEKEQVEGLRKLSHFTRILMSSYIREGIDLVLDKHKGALRKAEKGGKEEMTGG